MRRGQSSFEFIVLLGFMVIVFLGFFLAIQVRIGEQQRVNRLSVYGQLADLVEQEVILSSRVKSGYIRSFSLPATLQGEPYNISLEGQDTLVIQGYYSQNDYIRFLDSNLTLVQPSGDTSPSLVPPGTTEEKKIILEKNDSGIFLRKDCVANGSSLADCQGE